MPDIRELSADEFDMERMLGIEQEEYRKHVRLWEEGKIDLSVTRFSSIVPALQAAGVKVYFPFPSKRYVGEMCDKLLNEIERRKLEEQRMGFRAADSQRGLLLEAEVPGAQVPGMKKV